MDTVRKQFEAALMKLAPGIDASVLEKCPDDDAYMDASLEQGYQFFRLGQASNAKDVQRWQEFCAAVNQARASDSGHAPLWNIDECLHASVMMQYRGTSQIKVEFYYEAPNEEREDLGAAIDAAMSKPEARTE